MRRYLMTVNCSESSCPFYSNCRKLPTEVHTDETDTIDILFVGHGGGKSEQEKGLPFSGTAGSLFRSIINWMSKHYKVKLAFSNSIRSCPKDEHGADRAPDQDELGFCLPHLLKDIDRLKPKVIMPLGKSALDVFVDEAGSILEDRSRIFNTINGIVIPTIHPAAAIKSPNFLSILFEDIQKAILVATDKFAVPFGYDKLGEAHLLKTIPEIKEFVDFLLNDLSENDYVATDTETKNLYKRYGNRVATIQIAYDDHNGYMIPFDHISGHFNPTQRKEVANHLRRLYTSPQAKFKYHLMHNATFDSGRIYNEMGIRIVNKPIIDTMVFAFLLDENKWKAMPEAQKCYRLKHLCKEFYGFTHYDKGILAEREEGTLADLPLFNENNEYDASTLPGYGCMDAYCTYRIFKYEQQFAQSLGYYNSVIKLLEHLYSPVYTTLSLMEINGFPIDVDFLHLLQSEDSPIWKRLEEINIELQDLENVQKANEIIANNRVNGQSTLFTPWVFDLSKKDCLVTLFRDVMGFDGNTKKSDMPSYDKKWYGEFNKGEYTEIDLYAEFQGLKKLGTGYTNQLDGFLNPDNKYLDCQDGRIRGSFWLTGTVTGRTSSSGPNMQNQPRSDNEEKKMIKNLFMASPGHALVQLDAQTAEVRWWCLLSKDPKLAQGFNDAFKYIEMYRKDPNPEFKAKAKLYGDFHTVTASMMFGVPVEKVAKDQRQAAKNIVFGLIYGRGVASIAIQIKKTKEETQKLVDQFFSKFPVGTNWLASVEAITREELFYETPLGRRRRLPFFLNEKLDHHTKNQAVNSPVQATSSDSTLMMGSSLMTEYILDNNKPWKGMNIVHDSFVAEVPYDDIVEYTYTAEDMFTTKVQEKITKIWGFEFNCPLAVDFEIGNKWGKLYKWDGVPANLDEIVEKVRNE